MQSNHNTDVGNLQSSLNTNVATLQSNIDGKADSSHTHTTSAITDLETFKSELIDLFYPVGSVYINMSSAKSPAETLGGTWESITNRFLYSVSSGTNSAGIAPNGATGGSAYITEANLPAHTHTFTGVKVTETLNVRPATNNKGVLGPSTSNGYFTLNSRGGGGMSDSVTVETNWQNCDNIAWTYTPSGTLSSTGSGSSFLPPYITYYAWRRTA